MKKRKLILPLLATVALSAAMLAGCSGGAAEETVEGTVTTDGSTSMERSSAAWARHLKRKTPASPSLITPPVPVAASPR